MIKYLPFVLNVKAHIGTRKKQIMKVKRTEQIWIKTNKDIGNLSHISKNLYNESNYIIRQEFINNGRYINYNEIDPIMQKSKNAIQLPGSTRQQILRNLEKNWIAFFRSIRDWKKHPEKYKGMPGLPKYKKKDGEHILFFTNHQCKIKDGILRFPKKCNFMEVRTRIKNKDLQHVRILPKGVGYLVEIVYWKHIKPEELDKTRRLNIDPGLKNLVTLTNNIGQQPIVIKGNIAKSVNQYFNKKYAKILHQFDMQGINESKRFYRLINKRNRKIKNFFHVATKHIIDYCIANDIGAIVIGHNPNQKQKINIGKKNNQKFVQLPFAMLKEQLQYKGEEAGIDVILQDESHTSKCSVLDKESIEHHDVYLGKRFSRGLFRSAKGKSINADVQGSYNIGFKAFPKTFTQVEVDGIEDVGLHPLKHSFIKNKWT